MKYGFISAHSVYYEWKSQFGPDLKDNEDISLIYVNEAVSSIIKADQYMHNVALITIENYKGKLPPHHRRTAQVLFKYDDTPRCNRVQIKEWTKESYMHSGCKLNIKVECPECTPNPCSCESALINLNSFESEELFPQIKHLHEKHIKGYRILNELSEDRFEFTKHFHLIYPAQNDFFGMQYHLGDCDRPTMHGRIELEPEYIIEPPIIRLNIKSGQVLMSCLTAPVDEDGDLLVPDCMEVIRAVKQFLTYKMAYDTYVRKKDQQSRVMWKDMEQEWLRLLPIAKSKANMIEPDRLFALLNNHWNKMIKYHDHRENLNRAAPDRFRYKFP